MPTEDIPERGLISRWLGKLFGANWRSSASGYVTILAGIIHEKPEWIAWINEPLRGIIWSCSGWVILGGLAAFVKSVKDGKVTGGSEQQTLSGAQVDLGKQTMVDQTVKATIASGEHVSEEVKDLVK